MDEGAFDQNFTWYEWGFVNPTEIPHDDLSVPPDGSAPQSASTHPAQGAPGTRYPAIEAMRLLKQWDEEK